MLALFELVAANAGRVILSGDTRQHGPVEASDALRAIERYSGLRAAELNAIRRQDPARAATEQEREKIRRYRDAVKAAAEGDVAESFAGLERSMRSSMRLGRNARASREQVSRSGRAR